LNIINIVLILLLFTFAFSGLANINQKFFPFLIEKDYYKTIYAQTGKIYNNEEIESKLIVDYYFDPSEFFEDDSIGINKYKDKIEIEESVISNALNSIDKSESRKISYEYNHDNKLSFNFVSVGDFDCKRETRNTIQNIVNLDPVYVLALGDYSYSKSADCWFKIVEPIRDKLKATMGNHDSESSTKFTDYMNYFGLKKQYYSFNHGNVHFLSLSTEVPFHSQSSQYEFVINDLEKTSSNFAIEWIIVFFHRQMYGSGSLPDDEINFRDTYHSIFDLYNIDLVLQAHQHIYERIYPIAYNQQDSDEPLIVNQNYNTYIRPQAPIFVTVGTGGASPTNLSYEEDYTVLRMIDYGVLNINIDNNKMSLEAEFINNNGVIKDSFLIVK
jgi:hypothetical protein